MKKFLLSLFALMFLMSMPASSKADTDQRCLNLCIADGKSSNQCLSECSYTIAKPPVGLNTPVGQQHNVFKAPAPLNEVILPSSSAFVKTLTPSKDYKCISECSHNGVQYQMCEHICTKPVCAQKAVLCKDSITAPGPVLAPGSSSVPVRH